MSHNGPSTDVTSQSATCQDTQPCAQPLSTGDGMKESPQSTQHPSLATRQQASLHRVATNTKSMCCNLKEMPRPDDPISTFSAVSW
jgi:hypothetical protein